jgi:predicted transcriptional regulator
MKKEKLEELVEAGLSSYEIADEIGMSPSGLRYWLSKYGLKTKFKPVGKRTWTDKQLKNAVKTSFTKAEVIRKLGLSDISSENYQTLNKHIKRLGLDVSHFTGQAHGKSISNKISNEDVFKKTLLITPLSYIIVLFL